MNNIYLKAIIILLLGFTNFVMGQAPNFQWAKAINGASSDAGRSISVDASGNVYTAGYFTGIADFDPGSGTYTLSSFGSQDVFIQKLDSNGNFIWAKQFGGLMADVSNGIALDALGNIYTTGTFEANADFDPGLGTLTLTSAGDRDLFVSKLDAAGNFVWAKQMGGTSDEISEAITVDASGNVYTTGVFSLTADFDPGAGTFNLASAGNYDIFVSKLDAGGNFVWVKQFGGTSVDEGSSITVDATGSVYTTGSFQSVVDFDPGAGTFNLTAVGGNDIFVSKLDAAGNFVWTKQFGGLAGEAAYDIVLDTSGNIYTTGSTQGTADFDPGAGTFNLTSAGSNDNFISKLDASGNFVWAKIFGGSLSEASRSIALDISGNVYTTGLFQGNADFDPGAGTFNLVSAGNYDIFVSKLDAFGNFVWAVQFGSTAVDFSFAIFINSTYNVYVTGYFNNTVDFDPSVGTYNLTSAGLSDAFVHKMSQCIAPSTPTNTTPPVNQNICSNTSTTLNATATGTVNWFSTSTSTTVLGSGTSFTTPILAVGVYTYYAEANTCTTSAVRTPITFTVNLCTDIVNLYKSEGSFNVYPNPFNGSFNVNFGQIQDIENQYFEIYNMFGNLIYKAALIPGNQGNIKIDISEKPCSIYFLKLGNETKKIIKQ